MSTLTLLAVGRDSLCLEGFLQKMRLWLEENFPRCRVKKKRRDKYPPTFRPYLQSRRDRLVIFEPFRGEVREEYLLIAPDILVVFLPLYPERNRYMEKRILKYIGERLFSPDKI